MSRFFYNDISTSRPQEQGFTLIEAMFAMLVFTVGALAVSVLSVRGYNSFTNSRNTTAEVNRSIKNMDAVACSSYNNDKVFKQGGGKSDNYPFGTDDQNHVESWDFNDIVIADTKLIAIENTTIDGPSASLNYRLYLIKSQRTQVQ